MKIQAFATNSISESVVAFAQFARTNGMNIGMQETQDALRAADELVSNRSSFKFALKAIFCTSPEDGRLFERLYILFWDTNPIDLAVKNKTTLRGVMGKKQPGSLVMMGEGKRENEMDEGKNVTGADETQRLQKTDFNKINDIEAKTLEEIAGRLYKEMSFRIKRRMKESKKYGQINLRRTIRKSIGYGGAPIELCYKLKKPKKQRLVVLLDVSGSMDKYSFFLLRFVFALRENFRQMETFIFSTKLIRISSTIHTNQLESALALLSHQVDNWSGGTKIGSCLEEFYEKYNKRILNCSPVVIVLSDGLDTGDPSVLEKELRKIQLRSRKVIWLNPLKGMKGYEPLARGMKAALPSIDEFRPAHNLNSLLELENILVNV